MSKPKYETREQWLRDAAQKLKGLIDAHLGKQYGDAADCPGQPLNLEKVAVSSGLPKYSPASTIGQCWSEECTEDKTRHIFVCPTIEEDMTVLGVLLHELVHAGVGTKCGHKGEFRRVARAVGLEGKLTATVVNPESTLHEQLRLIISSLGSYPHSPLKLKKRPKKPPSGGWVKFRSTTQHDYILKISPRSLDLYGIPADHNQVPMEQDDTDSRKRE